MKKGPGFPMQCVVYCDESRHDGHADHRYMAIGGLWTPRESKPALTRKFRDLKRSLGLNGEVKWSKTSAARLQAYQSLVDFFIQEDLHFRVIVVDQDKVEGNRELGFYKFYYEMLIKWLTKDNQYLILLDFKQNKGADRYKTLRTFLDRKVKGVAWITDLTVIDSRQAPLAQLCDLLTGAVAASWGNGLEEGRPKAILARHIATALGKDRLNFVSGTPAFEKFNIFRIALS
jgi:hypothetical protein